MFARCAVRSAHFAKRSCSALVSKHVRPAVRPVIPTYLSDRWASNAGERKAGGRSLSIQPVRSYAEAGRKDARPSQLDDLPATMLKKEYTAVPLAQETGDVVRRLLSLELASHKEKLQLKEEQLVAKVRLHENDSRSVPVKVAILTARIRNYQEHLQQHPKDKANKRRMLMSVDSRKKMLKNLRRTRYDVFENVCAQLGITYTFPQEYYRRLTRRYLAKKALCVQVFNEIQKRRKELRRSNALAAAASKAKAEAADKAEAAKAGAADEASADGQGKAS